MTPEQIIDIFREALLLIITMVSVVILPSLCIGLIISVFQAATQINEQTLSFVPKLLIVLVSLLVFGPWLLKQISNYFETLITSINNYVI